MDILTHTLSGIAVATVVIPFTEKKVVKSLKILGFGALGGALPDIDAISMWSRFDITFGRLFRLSHTGREIYGEKFWYSHHAFFHSIAAALLIAALLMLAGYIFTRVRKNAKISLAGYCKRNVFLYVAFNYAYLFHLFGDMPTPSSVWNGVNMFFPSYAYVGGSGKIWWWNNYDIFILIMLCIVVNFTVILLCKKYARKITLCIAIVTFVSIIFQINTRQYNYAYKGNTAKYAEMEQQSKEEQERILGKRIYKYMKVLDSRLPIHF